MTFTVAILLAALCLALGIGSNVRPDIKVRR